MSVVIILPQETANDLAILLANITPKQTAEAAQKCAVLYGGKPVEFDLRFNQAAFAFRKELQAAAFRPNVEPVSEVRANFDLECG